MQDYIGCKIANCLLQGSWIPGAGMTVLQNLQTSGYGWLHGTFTELTQVPAGIVAWAYRTHCTSGQASSRAYISHSSSGYGYEGPTGFTRVPSAGVKLFQDSLKSGIVACA